VKHDFVIINGRGKAINQFAINKWIKEMMILIDDIVYSHPLTPDDVEGECAIEVEEDV
jgi:hypothetical protein